MTDVGKNRWIKHKQHDKQNDHGQKNGYQGVLQEDETVVLSGRISVREEESPKLLVDTVTLMDDWRQNRKSEAPKKTDSQLAQEALRKLFIRLPRQQMPEAVEVLKSFPGTVPTYLHIPQEKLTLLMPREQWCSAGAECLKALQARFGAENVKTQDKAGVQA